MPWYQVDRTVVVKADDLDHAQRLATEAFATGDFEDFYEERDDITE